MERRARCYFKQVMCGPGPTECVSSVIPEMVDHIGPTEEREDEGAGPAVALPDEVAARIPSLAKPLLCDGSV